ncbi:MAG: outer membrane beta-barrel protein [Acidobacteria bacterium]|nr:outer membrane beta-barrel protein [Acidobacteriota bacterium]
MRYRYHFARLHDSARFILILLTVAAPAQAQPQVDPATEARFRFGPLFFTPTIGISQLGIDSNVFNEAGVQQRDWTASVSPAVRGGLRFGVARLTGGAAVDFVYYKEFKDQQSVNQRHDVQLEVLLARLRPFAGVDFIMTRTRPDEQIDVRARRTEPVVRVGTDIKLTSLTTITLVARHHSVSFREGEKFLGQELRRTLNRRSDAFAGSVRFSLTPLTTFVLLAEAERSRFEFTELRDSNSVLISPGFEFSPDALLKGTAYAGFRRFHALTPGVPDFSGAIAAVSLSATALGTTRLDMRLERDVAYSLEVPTPYYVSTGGGVTVTQQVFGPFDVQGTVNGQRLVFRALDSVQVVLGSTRVDRVTIVGGGVGYRVGQTGRLGITVEYAERSSSTFPDRSYNRTRVFSSFTYGFK